MPKLDEEDFVDPGNLPSITQSRTPPPSGAAMGATMGSMAGGMMGNMGGGMMAGQMQQPVINKTAAGDNAAQNAEILVKNTNEDFINKKWRPMMGWTYMATCIFDFILAPILWAVIQFWETEAANDAFRQWEPLTLQGAGLYHMAMGAVLGIAAYGRTQEKLGSKQ
jgi:hypothetical protein